MDWQNLWIKVRNARPSSATFIVTMWLMSAPPMKARPPAPDNTTTRSSPSRANPRKASVRSSKAGGLSTFSRRELSKTTWATTPEGRRSQEISTLWTPDAMTFRSVALCGGGISSIRTPQQSFTRALRMPDSIDLGSYSVFLPPDPFEDHVGPFYYRIQGEARQARSVHCVLRAPERAGEYA